ncbi:MAG: hypothetical protein K2Y56_17795 [Methylobacterium sp.]|uniref:hypothetical protein n=1 Tax=Methylobacterium sp. TaxID=409 RepID=UPI0025DD397B|nr:hypothetical protein [Methylobacterium sp.]MBX9933360.1 hypothetical protein [Methylobacterium sp.]
MKAALLSLLVVASIVPSAQARPRIPGSPHMLLLPLEKAATACFAETVAANPRSITLARAGRWFEAASVTGFLCRPEVDAMVAAHDRAHGRGTGERYFRGPYAKHLGQQLAVQLQPLLEPKDVASAEPGVERASLGEGGSNPAQAE